MVGGVAAAAAVAGFFVSNVRQPATHPVATPAVAADPLRETSVALQPVGSNSAEGLPVTKQFVFYSPTARSVSVVGDFNRWNAGTTRMERSANGDLWSVTVQVTPGRHMYGFMVDDSLFVLDPREPKGRDADLGVEASVIIVGRP
jgi:1,4-alpha-glucan branching enzyme